MKRIKCRPACDTCGKPFTKGEKIAYFAGMQPSGFYQCFVCLKAEIASAPDGGWGMVAAIYDPNGAGGEEAGIG